MKKQWVPILFEHDQIFSYSSDEVGIQCLTQQEVGLILSMLYAAKWPTRWDNFTGVETLVNGLEEKLVTALCCDQIMECVRNNPTILIDIIINGPTNIYTWDTPIRDKPDNISDIDCLWGGCYAIATHWYAQILDVLDVIDAALNVLDGVSQLLGKFKFFTLPYALALEIFEGVFAIGSTIVRADMDNPETIEKWACTLFNIIQCGETAPYSFEWVDLETFYDNLSSFSASDQALAFLIHPMPSDRTVYGSSRDMILRRFYVGMDNCSDDWTILCDSCGCGDLGGAIFVDWQYSGSTYAINVLRGSYDYGVYRTSPNSLKSEKWYSGTSYQCQARVEIILPSPKNIDSTTFYVHRTTSPWTAVTAVYVQAYDEYDTLIHTTYLTEYWSDTWKAWSFTGLDISCAKKIVVTAANSSPSTPITWDLWIDDISISG